MSLKNKISSMGQVLQKKKNAASFADAYNNSYYASNFNVQVCNNC